MAMEETYTLTCKFKDTENKTRTIEVNNPTANLTNDKILDSKGFHESRHRQQRVSLE